MQGLPGVATLHSVKKIIIIGKNASLANFTKLIRLMNLTAYDFFILPVGINCVVIGVLILIFTASFLLAALKSFFQL